MGRSIDFRIYNENFLVFVGTQKEIVLVVTSSRSCSSK
jgi:hypothetical protein